MITNYQSNFSIHFFIFFIDGQWENWLVDSSPKNSLTNPLENWEIGQEMGGN
jgi:hypothetical protein